jgi:hypothetical protein
MPAVPNDEFQYALLRVVPRLERGEAINAGVVLFCRRRGFLAARVRLDRDRLAALDANADADAIERHLDALARIASGADDAGPVARMPQSERFSWLVAPTSTIVQPSAVHTGFCDDPEFRLERLFAELVA